MYILLLGNGSLLTIISLYIATVYSYCIIIPMSHSLYNTNIHDYPLLACPNYRMITLLILDYNIAAVPQGTE